MKKLFITVLFLNASIAMSAHAQTPEIFQRQSLIHWTVQLGLIAIGTEAPSLCNQDQQASVKETAAEAAQNDCAAAGIANCFIKSMLITTNGPISDEILQQYGQPPATYLGPEVGCIGEATIYGYR